MAIDAEETMQILERFTKLKQKDIPKELEEYLMYVAKTGDIVYTWANIKYLFREKLIHVIKDFHESTSNIDDLPQYPNVDPFNYETMKSALLERLDLFISAPFTVQRLSELLTEPRKQYSRIDKFMRALEKNILVVSTVEPGRKQNDNENGDSALNGDLSLDVNVDVDMDNDSIFTLEPQQQNDGPHIAPTSHKTPSDNDIDLPSAKKIKLDFCEFETKNLLQETDDISTNKKDSEDEEKKDKDETDSSTDSSKSEKDENEENESGGDSSSVEKIVETENDLLDKLKPDDKITEGKEILKDEEAEEALIQAQEDKLLNVEDDVDADNEDIENPLSESDERIEAEIEKDDTQLSEKASKKLDSPLELPETSETSEENLKPEKKEVRVTKSPEKVLHSETHKKEAEVKDENVDKSENIPEDEIFEEKKEVFTEKIEKSTVTNIIDNKLKEEKKKIDQSKDGKIPEQMSVEEVITPIAETLISPAVDVEDVNIVEESEISPPILDQPMEENIEEAISGTKVDDKVGESNMEIDDTSQEAMDQ